jgi:hypothetical protein
MPTENDEPIKSVPFALQRVFYQVYASPPHTKKKEKKEESKMKDGNGLPHTYQSGIGVSGN